VALDSEVEGVLEPHIADSVFVGLAGLHGVSGLKATVLTVDVDPTGPAKAASTVQELLESLVGLAEPVTDEDPELVSGVSIGHWDQQAAVDSQTTEASDGALHADGGVVEVATDLVLNLEVVGVVGARLDGALGAWGTILPGVFPVLDTIPGEEDWLVKEVKDIDDNVIVAGAVYFRAWELAVDEDPLLFHTQWCDGAVGDVPCVVHIRIFTTN